MTVSSGLDRVLADNEWSDRVKGRVGYLCHSASVDKHLKLGIYGLKKLLGERFCKVFSPQHGLFSDVQDNMVESGDFFHPYFQLQIHSLYSDTRIPTDEMLQGLDTVIVDMQDVGTRIYTYIYTMTLLMEACGPKGIDVVVLDRPNPIGGVEVEGNILDPDFASFVGRHPLPVRHGLTIGEVAVMANKHFGSGCELTVVPMDGWKREMSFEDTGLPWVLPSPNMPTIDAAFVFPGTVAYEGTNISEGRGTTRSLEIIGHPAIEPFSLLEKIQHSFDEARLSGVVLRPLHFLPTFQKHGNVPCGGYQIHVTDRAIFKPWRVSQMLMRDLYHHLGDKFAWKEPPYEYEYKRTPVDLINGGDYLRKWVEANGTIAELDAYEQVGFDEYLQMREGCLLYQ